MELPLIQCKKCKHLTKITSEYLCPFDWCENVLDSPDRDLQRRCKHYQAATNADKIRSMMDEELAEYLFIKTCEDGFPQFITKNDWLNWLEQELSDEQTNNSL